MSMPLQQFRKRLPLVVFLLLLLVCVGVLALACACLTDHPLQVLAQAFSALAGLPAVVMSSPPLVLSLLGLVTLLAVSPLLPRGRASPAALQRFLF